MNGHDTRIYKIYIYIQVLRKKLTSWDVGKSSTYTWFGRVSRSLDRSTAGRDRRKRDDSRAHPMPGGTFFSGVG